MSSALRISEAASLALHSLALMAARPRQRLTTSQMAGTLGISEAHLSKVLQRLTRSGLLTAVRGPTGGFLLARPPARITLLEAYEAIDGPLGSGNCLLGEPACNGKTCILGGLLRRVNQQVRQYLTKTKLSDVAKAYAEKGKPSS